MNLKKYKDADIEREAVYRKRGKRGRKREIKNEYRFMLVIQVHAPRL
jgi:hypothetical protein